MIKAQKYFSLYFTFTLITISPAKAAGTDIFCRLWNSIVGGRQEKIVPAIDQAVKHTKVIAKEVPLEKFNQRSVRFGELLKTNTSQIAQSFGVSEEVIVETLGHRKQALFRIKQTVNFQTQQGQLLRNDLTSQGLQSYRDIGDYQARMFSSNSTSNAPMTIKELETSVVRGMGGPNMPMAKNFKAISDAMNDFEAMIEWQQHIYDASIDYLLSSHNKDWINAYFEKGVIPREVTERVLLERASAYGWPDSFTDLSGGQLRSDYFGEAIAKGKYLRETDLDETVLELAQNDKFPSSLKDIAKGVVNGEIKHGALTHAAQMDYLLYMASKNLLGPVKPEELRITISKFGEYLKLNTRAKMAWGSLFDQSVQGKTPRSPHLFRSTFGRELNL